MKATALRALRTVLRWVVAAARWCSGEWLSEIAFIPCAIALSWSMFWLKGIPLTDDGLGLPILEAYRRSYHGGEYFPLWTPFAQAGHGSALPILYHRLHGQVFGVLALWTGSVLAMKISVPVLLTVGAAGMRRLCRAQGARRWLAWLAGVLLMSANYTVSDWFIRGAIAELTAFMLVPWCIRYAFEIFTTRWGPVRLACSAALLFYAHMLTFYSFVFVAIAVMLPSFVRLCPFGWVRIRKAIWAGMIFVVLLACAIGPYAAAVKYALAFSALGALGMRADAGAYFQWSAYLKDPNYSWSRAFVDGKMSVEIGRWCLLCLAVALLLDATARSSVRRRAGGLAALAVFFVWLQRQQMSFFFDLLPGASKVQLPSRLLVYVVPITILCTAIAVERTLRSTVPFVRAMGRVMPLVATAGQVNLAANTQWAVWKQQVERPVADDAMADERDVTTGKLASYSTWDVFLPKGHKGVLPPAPFLQASDGCTLSSPQLMDGANTQVVKQAVVLKFLSFTVHGTGCSVKVSQYQSSLLRYEVSQPGALRMADDGTTILDTPNDGTIVHMRERGVLDLAKKWIIQVARRRP